MEDLVLYAVDYARSAGATYAEARYHRNSLRSIISNNGSILGVGSEVVEGMGIRVIVGGALGFSATNRLERSSIKAAVDRAISQARSAFRLMKHPIELAESKLGRAKYSVLEAKHFDSLSFEEKACFHTDLWKATSRSISEAKASALFIEYTESFEEKIVANSDGAFIESKVPRIALFYNLVITHPQKGSIQRWEMLGASGGLEWLDKWRLINRLEEDAKTYEKILLTAIEPPKDAVDLVIGSEIVGLMVHESCGHPSEADRILGREAAQAGKSFIKRGMIGERIGNENATVIDDPSIPGSYGFYLYDDEGVPAKPRYLYKEGVINEHLHNRWTAKVYGVESNAAARSMDYKSEPIVRMANTYLKPGNYRLEELIEDIELGVYMKSYMEWNIDDERWSQRYVGLEAYLIERGEIKGFVKNPALEITTGGFYSNIDAVGREVKFYAGTCGKGEPPQGVPVWFGGPDVKLRKVRLGVSIA
ncbi:MAG: TldD/PmbA family protein [Desulfurococcaceae archaeon]